MKTLINFFVAILILSISTKSFSQTDLKKTIYDFAEQYTKDSIIINNKFLLTYNEFKNLPSFKNITSSNEQKVLDYYNTINEGIKQQNNQIKTDLGKIFSIVSFDTVSYKQSDLSYIDVAIVFRNKSPYFNLNQTTSTVQFVFVQLNNELKLYRTYTTSDLHFNLNKLDRIKNLREEELNRQYKGLFFNDASNNCIPFKKNNKWGLISFNNEILLKPLYDSIYPFKAEYAMVILNGLYNLVDKKFKIVFSDSKKRIKLVENEYFVLNNQNKYIRFPNPLKTGDESEGETVMIPKSIQPTNSQIYKQAQSHSKLNYIIKQSNDRSTFFVIDNASKDTISINKNYQYLDPHNEFIFGLSNDNVAKIINPKGVVLFANKFICQYKSVGYLDIFNGETRLFGMYLPYTNVYILPKYKLILAIDRDKFFIVLTKDGTLGYLDSKGKELF